MLHLLNNFAENTVPKNTLKKRSITLNNFLHRIDCKTTIIELATQQGCSLKRIRRSKNWLLIGNQKQLASVSKHLQREAVSFEKTKWITKVIENALPKSSVDLALIIKSRPNITINQLIIETGCTSIEARAALDKAEDLF